MASARNSQRTVFRRIAQRSYAKWPVYDSPPLYDRTSLAGLESDVRVVSETWFDHDEHDSIDPSIESSYNPESFRTQSKQGIPSSASCSITKSHTYSESTSRCNRPLPTSLGLATSLVEGGALMWDSPSVVAGKEGRSSPVPNDLRGRRPHHSGAGLLRPVIPATCATVSLTTDTVAPEKTPSDSESISDNTDVRFPPCRLPLRPTRFVLPTSRKPSLLEAGGSASENAEPIR